MTSRINLCKKCPTPCCKHPVFTTEEYVRMFAAIGLEAAIKAEPEFIGNVWQFKALCPGSTEDGCILSYQDRPKLCRLYPFMPVPTRTLGTILLLDVEHCPQWRVFGTDLEKAKKEYHDEKEN